MSMSSNNKITKKKKILLKDAADEKKMSNEKSSSLEAIVQPQRMCRTKGQRDEGSSGWRFVFRFIDRTFSAEFLVCRYEISTSIFTLVDRQPASDRGLTSSYEQTGDEHSQKTQRTCERLSLRSVLYICMCMFMCAHRAGYVNI